MILILEGPERCGKTTLAKYLVEQEGFEYYKDTAFYSMKDMSSEVSRAHAMSNINTIVDMLDFAVSDNIDLIIDRLHYSELVYGSLNRHNSVKPFFRSMDTRLAYMSDKQIKLIMLTDDTEKLSRRNEKDMHDYNIMYNVVYNESILNRIKCKATDLDDIQQFLGINTECPAGRKAYFENFEKQTYKEII